MKMSSSIKEAHYCQVGGAGVNGLLAGFYGPNFEDSGQDEAIRCQDDGKGDQKHQHTADVHENLKGRYVTTSQEQQHRGLAKEVIYFIPVAELEAQGGSSLYGSISCSQEPRPPGQSQTWQLRGSTLHLPV